MTRIHSSPYKHFHLNRTGLTGTDVMKCAATVPVREEEKEEQDRHVNRQVREHRDTF